MWWRDRFSKGVFGIGGDLQHVKDGQAELRIVEFPAPDNPKPSRSTAKSPLVAPKMQRMVINEAPGNTARALETVKPVEGMRIVGARTIVGPFIELVKGSSGSVAKIDVQEGMWEVKRGEKVDGGERRKVQVRRKRLLEERKKSRT